MSERKAIISWQRTSPDLLKGKYSREHTGTFEGGFTMPASLSPSVVPAPFSNPAHVDPEEAFVCQSRAEKNSLTRNRLIASSVRAVSRRI